MDNKIWNVDDDRAFESLAKTLSARDVKKKKRVEFDGPYDGLDMDPRLLNPLIEEYEEDDSNDLYLRDYSRPGPGLSRDFDLSFWLPLLDKGDGEVNILNHRGEAGTFTRASIATTVDRNGLVKQVASGVPRSYYDPTTLEYRGYLAEGARTNLFLRSEEFDNASWSKGDTTITANAVVAPDGALTADLLTEGSAGTAFVHQENTVIANSTNTWSVWLKRGNHDWVRLIVPDPAAGSNFISGWFNLATGAVGNATNGGTGSGATISMTAYPNGWYRCVLTGAVNNSATTLRFHTVSASSNGSDTRVADGTRYQWGAQVEAGAFASSYIPTTSAAVTRNADQLEYPPIGVNGLEGTAYAELSTAWGAAAPVACAVNTEASGTGLLRNTGNLSTQIGIHDGSTFLLKSGIADMNVSAQKCASSWGAHLAVTGNGLTPATGSFSGQLNVSSVSIGAIQGSSQHWFGTLRNVRIWKRQMPDAELQALTA